MSRVGRKPIKLPAGIHLVPGDGKVVVEGPLGRIEGIMPAGVSLKVEGDVAHVIAPPSTRINRGYQGLMRALLANMVHGVLKGYSRSLEIQGVGYRAELQGKVLKVAAGHSHTDYVNIPEGLKVEIDKSQTKLAIKGNDKQAVGQLAAEIRSIKPPEPYKGKGIKYADEVPRRKAGKAGSK